MPAETEDTLKGPRTASFCPTFSLAVVSFKAVGSRKLTAQFQT